MDTRALTQRYWRTVNPNWKYAAGLGLLALVYVLAARFGLSLAHTTKQVTVVWPPSGIALVALLVFGLRYWPGIFLGAFIANWFTNEQALVALGIAAGNTLEAVAAVYVLQRLTKFHRTFQTPKDAIAFSLVAVSSTLIAAGIGTACLAIGGLISWGQYQMVALNWWQGDTMGMLVFGSFLLVYLDKKVFEIVRGRWVEAAILVAIVLGASLLVFHIREPGPFTYPYILFPVLVWAAARFTQVGVATSGLMVAVVAIWTTLHLQGPFVQHEQVETALVHLQVFVCVLTASSLTLAMAITERMEAEAALSRQTRKLERLDRELTEANKRITKILAGILDQGGEREPRHNRDRGH